MRQGGERALESTVEILAPSWWPVVDTWSSWVPGRPDRLGGWSSQQTHPPNLLNPTSVMVGYPHHGVEKFGGLSSGTQEAIKNIVNCSGEPPCVSLL